MSAPEVRGDAPPPGRTKGRTPAEFVPDETLLAGLRGLLPAAGEHDRLVLVDRTPNPYASSCPSEVVTVEVAGIGGRHLFCKYEFAGVRRPWSHRRGLLHEARVHREVLEPLAARVPRALGTWQTPDASAICLVTEALAAALPLRKLGARRIVDAAEWLGRFHGGASGMAATPAAAFAVCYDEGHFLHWMQSAQHVAVDHGFALPWLPVLAEEFARRAPGLARTNPTIVHGEYYPMNILATESGIWPIDWESAGVGPGEIDLASLTMGWPAETIEECLAAYGRARWPGGAPPDHRANLATARLYLCLRMLGDNDPRREGRQARTPFFDYLLRQSRECGFLAGVAHE